MILQKSICWFGVRETFLIITDVDNSCPAWLLKGIVNPNFCHYLLTLMLFQTCMSLFFMLNIQEDILKNAGNQTADGPHWLP